MPDEKTAEAALEQRDAPAGEPASGRALTLAAAVGASMLATVLLLYFFKFGGSLSSDAERWGQFGDYVGGILNAIFGLLAFLAILLTIRLQLQELRENRLETRRAELQRVIQSLGTDLQTVLAKPVTCETPWIWGNRPEASAGIREVPLRTLLLSDGIDWKRYLAELQTSTKFRLSQAGELVQDRDVWLQAYSGLDTLMRVLEEYQRIGGQESLVSYYRNRYQSPLARFQESEESTVPAT